MTTYTQLSGDNSVDALLLDFPTWNSISPAEGNTVYYTFDGGGGNTSVSGNSLFNSNMESAASQILTHAGSITGINFVETSNSSLARIFFYGGFLSGNTAGTAYYSSSGGSLSVSTIYLDTDTFFSNLSPTAGTQGYETLLHEVGHSLGLDHPHQDIILTDEPDNTNYTVMSYTDAGSYKSQFQTLDVGALNWIYGADGIRGDWGINSVNGPTLGGGGGGGGGGSDTTPPSFISIESSDGNSFAIDDDLVITFDETIELATGNITLKTALGTILESYSSGSDALSISGSTITINPTLDLDYSTGYIIQIDSGAIEDSANNAYTTTTQHSFVTESRPDNTPPSILSITPNNGTSDVDINTAVVISFDELVQKGSGYITLKNSAGSIIARYTASNDLISFRGTTVTIDLPLDYASDYRLEIDGNAIRDISGNKYAGIFNYEFTTAPDTSPPTITILSPNDGATGVEADTLLQLTFNEGIMLGAGQITIKDQSGTLVESFDVEISSAIQITNNTITLEPTNDLPWEALLTLNIESGAVTDLVGNSFVETNNYSFTTMSEPDLIAPILVSTNPSQGETSVAVQQDITIVFDEDIRRSHALDSSLTILSQAGTPLGGNLSIAGNTITIDPYADFLYGTSYTIALSDGYIEDLSGNDAIGTTLSFKTQKLSDGTGPSLVNTSHPNGADTVGLESIITLEFDQLIRLASGEISLTNTTNDSLPITVGIDPLDESTLKITLPSPLDYASNYTLSISSDAITDIEGDTFIGKSFTFTTIRDGTDENDQLVGSEIADVLHGFLGNDSFTGGNGDDLLDGGNGIDTALYTDLMDNYSLTPSTLSSAQWLISHSSEGADTLINIERIEFSDINLALDIDGNAGDIAKVLGALFGTASLELPEYVGAGLQLRDNGMTLNTLVDTALNLRLGKNYTSEDEITLLYQNLVSALPSAADIDFWMNAIDSGQYTNQSLALMAIEHDINTTNINLLGLSETGIEFTLA